ncbi:protein of unknown function [Methylocaldum szegediense]|uniref:Uncharacterized protein n=1 Tax=Methylocaldum szegediense TaxID=73780 RepID=A0ABM9I954_9GAMM|nr:protein of unknown function [Methylocaldum szegediense]
MRVSIHSRLLSRELPAGGELHRPGVDVSIHSRLLSRELPASRRPRVAGRLGFNPLPVIKPGVTPRTGRSRSGSSPFQSTPGY